MGLIDAIRRYFWTGSGTAEPGPRVAELVRQEQELLGQALAGAAYELREVDLGTCLVVTDRFTVRFGWWWRERWITTALLLRHPPEVPFEFEFDTELETRSWLKAAGIRPPEPRVGFRSADLVRDELELLRQVVAYVLTDEKKVKQAAFFLAGELEGYNDVAVVPEDLPPDPIIRWTEQRLRRSGRGPKLSPPGYPASAPPP